MAKLIKAVHVKDPDRNRTVLLLPGEEPEPRLAARITNPDAWENGELPDLETDTADSDKDSKQDNGSDNAPQQAAPAAKKTAAKRTAASSRSRGRDAADEGSSGE
ncbi:hypothetical protein ACWC4D_33570 [Streptomyces sp. NPDC001288]